MRGGTMEAMEECSCRKPNPGGLKEARLLVLGAFFRTAVTTGPRPHLEAPGLSHLVRLKCLLQPIPDGHQVALAGGHPPDMEPSLRLRVARMNMPPSSASLAIGEAILA